MTVSTLELAGAVLDWARLPRDHGGNPYTFAFVQLALKAKDEAAPKAAKNITEAELDARQRQRHGEAIARRKAANTPWPAPEPRQQTIETEQAKCDDCQEVWPLDSLNDMAHFYERYSLGSQVPMGDCPSCGAFCYITKPKRFDIV